MLLHFSKWVKKKLLAEDVIPNTALVLLAARKSWRLSVKKFHTAHIIQPDAVCPPNSKKHNLLTLNGKKHLCILLEKLVINMKYTHNAEAYVVFL